MVGCHRFSGLVLGLLGSAVTESGTPVLLGYRPHDTEQSNTARKHQRGKGALRNCGNRL